MSAEQFAKACAPHAEEAGRAVDTKTIRWFPERTYGDRTYVPATADGVESESGAERIEYYGHVSFERPADEGEPSGLRAKADFTDVTAEDNPDWRMDLNDDVIGRWYAAAGRGGDLTLIWGLPLIRGAVAATAELDGEVVDQGAIEDGRFTLVAVDAIEGFGDTPLYLEIVLWDRSLRRVVASESLYADSDEGDDEDSEDAGAEGRKADEEPATAEEK